MRIPRIYQDIELAAGHKLVLDASASQHLLKVLRLREGATVIVFDGRGVSCRGVLTGSDGGRAKLELQERIEEHTHSPLRLHIGLGISKGERMDYAIQKLVETGVHEITPLLTEHTVVRLDPKRAQSRLQHWRGIIINACEQCGRNLLPVLHSVTTAGEWMKTAGGDCKLVFDAEGSGVLRSL